MTEPERISKRSSGLAAELLLAGADEQPSPAGLARTLAALGASGAVLTSAGAASAVATTAAAGSVGASGVAAATATGTKAVNAVSALLLAKWVGWGVVGGMGLAGAAAVVSGPAASVPPPLVAARPSARPKLAVAPPTTTTSLPVAADAATAEVPAPEASLTAAATEPGVSAASARAASPKPLEVGAPLAAEVAVVDSARAALAAGDDARGLAELARYEQQFSEARLLPEVLFLRMEASARLGRRGEARAAAARLVEGFPKSPHVSRARALLREASP
jgi:hypothetical protein